MRNWSTSLSRNSLNPAYFGAEQLMFKIRGKYSIPTNRAHAGKTWIVSLTCDALEPQNQPSGVILIPTPRTDTQNTSVVIVATFITIVRSTYWKRCGTIEKILWNFEIA